VRKIIILNMDLDVTSCVPFSVQVVVGSAGLGGLHPIQPHIHVRDERHAAHQQQDDYRDHERQPPGHFSNPSGRRTSTRAVGDGSRAAAVHRRSSEVVTTAAAVVVVNERGATWSSKSVTAAASSSACEPFVLSSTRTGPPAHATSSSRMSTACVTRPSDRKTAHEGARRPRVRLATCVRLQVPAARTHVSRWEVSVGTGDWQRSPLRRRKGADGACGRQSKQRARGHTRGHTRPMVACREKSGGWTCARARYS
jgi:hypothetical protein